MDYNEQTLERAHYLIAGRLLWDPCFINSLRSNPKDALTETLLMGGIDPNVGDVLNTLLKEYEENDKEILERSYRWYSPEKDQPRVA